ncbi:MAG: hypothetical protein LKH78_12130 [Weizmannia coagulans]|nr:hypothetical protein [Heyndrickxia coagulans]
MEKDKAHKAWRNEGKLDGECTRRGAMGNQTDGSPCIPADGGMCKILLEGANEWKKMGRRSII